MLTGNQIISVKLTVVGMLLLFSACQEGINDIALSEKKVQQAVLQKNEAKDKMVDAMTQHLASSLSSKEIRSFIKQKTIEQFDGDYNFLIETSKNNPVSMNANGRAVSLTFKEILSGKTSNSSGRTESTDFIDSLTALYPLLQVALPALEIGDAEIWDVEANPPLVGFVPSDYNESNVDAVIPAYDFEGNYHELNANEEPNQLVIIISDNERLIALEKPQSSSNGRGTIFPTIDGCSIMMTPYHASETHLYYFKEEVYPIINTCNGGGGGGGSGGGGTGGGSSTCDRERNHERDYINKAKFKDYGTIRQVEKWVSGKPEVRLMVAFAKVTNSSGYNFMGLSYAMGKKGWFKRKWFNEWSTIKNFDYQIVRWDPAVYGDRMYYSWIEEDPSLVTIDFEVNVSSTFNFLNTNIANVNVNGTGTFSIGGADDIISEPVEVEFCDNTDGEGFEYRSPMIFWINQQ